MTDSIRIYTWNVNGLRAAERKGFLDWLEQAQPDILCLQETKADPEQLSPELLAPSGYQTYWSSSERKGYSGVGLFTRLEPRRVESGLGIPRFDREGRTLIADYGSFVLISSYVPNGSRDHSRVPFKMEYKEALLETCERLRAEGRRVIVCGDINTAHNEIDLARPGQNQNSTGFLPVERAWIDRFLALGYVDVFRELYPEREAYSWWAYWGKARERNVGWRLDYFFVSPDLIPHVEDTEIHSEIEGSDHCPVSLVLTLPTP
ncbi:MAG: exodeoxyribonuclease III [Anaerolineales bacterium]|jgi:exodeoxyribonuclease-3